MKRAPYSQRKLQDLSLADELAIDRTALAHERTLLAYLRSGVGLALAGATLLHLFPQGYMLWVGAGAILLSVVVTTVGLVRWQRSPVRALARRLNQEPPE